METTTSLSPPMLIFGQKRSNGSKSRFQPNLTTYLGMSSVNRALINVTQKLINHDQQYILIRLPALYSMNDKPSYELELFPNRKKSSQLHSTR